METRPYSQSDNDTLGPWFIEHGFEAIDMNLMPPLGIVVEDDAGPQAAAWMYISTCGKTAIIGWPVTNPEAKPVVAAIALNKGIEVLNKTACDLGISIVHFYSANEGLLRIFKRLGFVETDTNATLMMFFNGDK